jgi:cytochrome c-type biogenesis protein CcmF
MIAEVGHFALVLALLVSLVQATIPLAGAQRNDGTWMALDRPSAILAALLVSFAFGALMYLHVVSDFSVLNVVNNSHTDKPLIYKITGVWGNHEGSMMLWVLILTLYGLAVSAFGGALPPGLRARALAVQGMIAAAFLAFILFTSNPFLRVDPAPPNGQGLNPLLQDPGLAIHPPFLYLGYVGFSMAFSFAMAALIEGRVDAAWARWVRPWTLMAWIALTLGVALGSWWSYYTLGWGGFWAWDPVENASFMPWLAGTALLHSAIVVEKRDTMKSWTIFLAIIAFSLSLLGTFLVRSGILTSVHGFASDPGRGAFILMLLAGVTGGALALYAFRAPALKGSGVFSLVSRESGLLFNNIVLSIAAGDVLVGTLYPLVMDALGLGKISVGPPYFNTVIAPVAVPLVLVTAIGPFLAWKRGDLRGALARMRYAGIVSLAVVALVWLASGLSWRTLWAAFGLGLAAWLALGVLIEWAGRVKLFQAPLDETLRRARNLPRSALGMSISHLGLALVIVGISGALAWQVERLQTLRPGDHLALAGYDLAFKSVDPAFQGPNYKAVRGLFEVTRDGRPVTTLAPERREYVNPPMPISKVAIDTQWFSDLYLVLGAPDGQGGFVVHAFYNPMISWLFYGSALLVLGGIVALSDGRHRVGAPQRGHKPAAKASAPAVATAASARVEPTAKGSGGRLWLYLVPFLAFAALAGIFVQRLHLVEQGVAPNLIPSVLINKPAPKFDLPALQPGQANFRTEDLKGKLTVISFFASWCGPCQEEHPVVSDLAKSGVRVVGINYKDRPEAARAWLDKLGDPYAQVAADQSGRTGIDFGLYGVPETYVVDQAGVIRFKQTGPLTAEIVKTKIRPLLEQLGR